MPEEPKAPSAWQIEQALAHWQRAQQQLTEDARLAEDEQAIMAELGGEAPPSHSPDLLLGRLIDAAVWAEAREDEAETLGKIIAARKQRYAKRKLLLRNTIYDLMTVLDTKRAQGTIGRATIRATPQSLVILDESQVPDAYVTTERKLNRKELREDLLLGTIIDGVTLSQGGTTLHLTT